MTSHGHGRCSGGRAAHQQLHGDPLADSNTLPVARAAVARAGPGHSRRDTVALARLETGPGPALSAQAA